MSWFTDVMLDIGELKRLIDKTPGTIFYYKMSGIWDKFLLCQYSNETEYLDYLLITISDLEETIDDLKEKLIVLQKYNEELKLVNKNKQDEIRKLRNKYE